MICVILQAAPCSCTEVTADLDVIEELLCGMVADPYGVALLFSILIGVICKDVPFPCTEVADGWVLFDWDLFSIDGHPCGFI